MELKVIYSQDDIAEVNAKSFKIQGIKQRTYIF